MCIAIDGYRFAPPILRRLNTSPAATALSSQFVLLPLLACAKALRDRRAPEDQRGLIGEALREVGVIVLHDVEHGFLGKPAMMIGKEFVQVSELFVVHGFSRLSRDPANISQAVDPVPAFGALGYLPGANLDGRYGRYRRPAARPLTIY
jgi:hypothetical protein